MEARNCSRCGKVFTVISSSICPECMKAEEDGFQRIKVFIEENPMCRISELAEGTGVPPKRILRYIKEGRLEISKGMRDEVKCDKCGKPINTGRYCDACIIEINQTVNELFNKQKKEAEPQSAVSSKAKMHIQPRRI